MKKITLVAVLMFLSVIAFAQKPVRFAVYVGQATPLGDFGRGDEIRKTTDNPLGDITRYAFLYEEGTQGYAGIGFNTGFDVTVALPVKGLGVFGGLDFFINANNSNIKSYFDDWQKQIEKEVGITSASFNLPNVINIPILFGVNYLHNFNNIIGIWGEAGIGPNFRLITDFTTEIKYTALQVGPEGNYDKITERYDYKGATTLGFKIGAGAMLWNRMSIGLDFYSLGSATVEGEYEYKMGDKVVELTAKDDDFKGKNKISASELVVRVGYHF